MHETFLFAQQTTKRWLEKNAFSRIWKCCFLCTNLLPTTNLAHSSFTQPVSTWCTEKTFSVVTLRCLIVSHDSFVWRMYVKNAYSVNIFQNTFNQALRLELRLNLVM